MTNGAETYPSLSDPLVLYLFFWWKPQVGLSETSKVSKVSNNYKY